MQNIYTTYRAEIKPLTYAARYGYVKQVKPGTVIPASEWQPSFWWAFEMVARRMAEYGLDEVEFTIHRRTTSIIPRREICNVLRGSRSKVNGPEIKAARAALSEIYVASQNRQLTVEEDAAARWLIREVHRLNRERVGVPLLAG